MDFSSINWLAVVLCVIASMVIGGVWFSPKVFYPAWWKAIGKTDKDMADMSKGSASGMWGVWVGTIVASLVQAIFMGLMVNAMGSMSGGATLASGAMAGFFLWLGFVAPSSLTNKLFADRLPAWFYEVGNHLVTFVVMGAIHGAMS
ncbi:MAG: DUF1761 domain-containing protein [Anaerolineales bacterium]|nr:DUF1761 domain-containing protein [Anaerolineales bacterium]